MIPLVVRLQKSFQAWAQPGFEPFRFDYNVDRIDALSTERAAEWDRIGKAAFLTLDEQREAVGYGALPKDGDCRQAMPRWSAATADQPRVPAGVPTAEDGRAAEPAEIREAGLAAARHRARRRDVEGQVQTATNHNSRVASDVD